MPVIVAVATAGVVWAVVEKLYVAPRDYQISELKEEVSRLKEDNQKWKASVSPTSSPILDSIALAETGVSQNASVTTNDGRCNIHIVRVSGDRITLTVAIDDSEPAVFEQFVGDRLAVDDGNIRYYIDLHRTRGDIVDLSVHQVRK